MTDGGQDAHRAHAPVESNVGGDELKAHTADNDFWVAVQGKVYDITSSVTAISLVAETIAPHHASLAALYAAIQELNKVNRDLDKTNRDRFETEEQSSTPLSRSNSIRTEPVVFSRNHSRQGEYAFSLSLPKIY